MRLKSIALLRSHKYHPTTGTDTQRPTAQECNDSKYWLVYPKQQSSFASAELVVLTEEHLKKSILQTTTLPSWPWTSSGLQSIVLSNSLSMTSFNIGTQNNEVERYDRYIHGIELQRNVQLWTSGGMYSSWLWLKAYTLYTGIMFRANLLLEKVYRYPWIHLIVNCMLLMSLLQVGLTQYTLDNSNC